LIPRFFGNEINRNRMRVIFIIYIDDALISHDDYFMPG